MIRKATVFYVMAVAAGVALRTAAVAAVRPDPAPVVLAEPLPEVNLSVSRTTVTESATYPSAVVTATLSALSEVPVTVPLAFGGSATRLSDYSNTVSSILIPAGSESGAMTLGTMQDTRDEATETITVSLAELIGCVAGPTNQVTVSITDDDPAPTVTLSASGLRFIVESGGQDVLVATLSAVSEQPVTVTLAVSGTATPGADYTLSSMSVAIPALSQSGAVALRAVQDALPDARETVVVDILSVTNGTESGTQRVTVGIVDDDQHWIGVGERVVAWTNSLPADRVRVGVRDEGVYRITADELAEASGWAAGAVADVLASGGLSLTSQGAEVAWTSDGGALYFYGLPAADLFAPENVYWLALGAGERMASEAALPAEGGGTNTWFMHEARYRAAFIAPYSYRDRRSSAATLTNVLNFGEWIAALSSQSRTLRMPGYFASSGTGVTVRVEVASYREFTLPDAHVCEILVNGVSCGSRGWSGEQALTFDYAVPAGAVTNDTVVLTVRSAGTGGTVSEFMLLDAALVYPRGYSAEGGGLRFGGGAQATVAVDGFPSSDIALWRVTDPLRPAVLSGAVWQTEGGGWSTAFACGDAGERYAAADCGEGCYAPSLSGVLDVDWTDPQEMPELAIVVPPRRWVAGFADAVQPLAAFRRAQGLRVRVVDAEELYNAFSGGLVTPAAFRCFSRAGVTNAAGQTLRYLLFAGYGGTDYKLDVFRLGEAWPYPALFPLYQLPIVETAAVPPGALLLPNDLVLGDASGDAVPEVAVGRLLATNAVELAFMVNKTIRYELAETWKNKAVFSADWQNTGSKYADFTGIASNTASGFPNAGWRLKPFYPGPAQSYLAPLWMDTYYGTGVYYEFKEGAGFYYFVGHSSDTIAGSTSANKLFDAPMLQTANWPFAPVALLMGCRMGRWTHLDLEKQSQCISEAAQRNRTSGFAAVIAASGYMTTAEATAFSYAFRNQIAAGAPRLGDVWCGAFAAMGGGLSSALQHLSLLGDPSLCIRADRTSRGTPTAWLIEQGLTNNPYADLIDHEGDGFATWMEVQAGTSYTQGLLRCTDLALPPQGGSLDPPAGVTLTFELLGGLRYRIEAADDLTAGDWTQVPWRPVGGGEWSWSLIEGDWPVKTFQVPHDAETARRYYRAVGE